MFDWANDVFHSVKIHPSSFSLADISLSNTATISRTNVASVGSVFNDTRKVKVLSLPETIKENRRFERRPFARNVDFSFIVSGSERTNTATPVCGLV